ASPASRPTRRPASAASSARSSAAPTAASSARATPPPGEGRSATRAGCGARCPRSSAPTSGPTSATVSTRGSRPMADGLRRPSRELLVLATSSRRDLLDPWIVDRIVPWIEERHVAAGERLYAQGTAPVEVFYMAEGRVRFERAGGQAFVREGRWVMGLHE